MEQSSVLAKAAQTGDIDALYTLLRQNPYLLEDIDKIPFVDTPLHTAASAGNTHFAIEILGLKPSFAQKLNPEGYSPIDLALARGQTQTVKQLIRHDPELIRVKSKQRFTPLHYVAEMDDPDLVAEFLVKCPKSIEELTVRGETAVHIAVRNNKMRAFKVLLGWLLEADMEHILNWQDDKGDTVLHIATSTNNSEVVNLILKNINITSYEKNAEGLTACDIARQLPNAKDNGSIAKRLGCAFKKTSRKNLADRFILISEASFWRQFVRLLSGNYTVTDKTREAYLVVLVLIATASYQAILTPPSVFAQKKYEVYNWKSLFRLFETDSVNSSVLQLICFLAFNSSTFVGSILWMCRLFETDGLGLVVKLSLLYLVIGYALVMSSYFPVLGPVVVVLILCVWCFASIVLPLCYVTVRKVLARGQFNLLAISLTMVQVFHL